MPYRFPGVTWRSSVTLSASSMLGLRFTARGPGLSGTCNGAIRIGERIGRVTPFLFRIWVSWTWKVFSGKGLVI